MQKPVIRPEDDIPEKFRKKIHGRCPPGRLNNIFEKMVLVSLLYCCCSTKGNERLLQPIVQMH